MDETDVTISSQKPLRPGGAPASSLAASYNAKPISLYYSLNNQILTAFDSFYRKHLFRGAYAYGLQFLEVALLEIPRHGYFSATKHEAERLDSAQNAYRVADQLEQILFSGLLLLDAPTDGQKANRTHNHPSDLERISKFKFLAQEELNEIHDKQRTQQKQEPPEGKNREQLQAESYNSVPLDSKLCCDLLEYTNMCGNVNSNNNNSSSAWEEPKQERQTTTAVSGEDVLATQSKSGTDTSSYQQQPPHRQSNRPISSAASALMPYSNGRSRIRSLTSIDISSLQLCYHEDFDELCRRGQVRISRANTYQGRLPGSANGCTVIALLLCVHHFCNTTTNVAAAAEAVQGGQGLLQIQGNDDGLPDATIIQVIDEETPVMLPNVRSKLGLIKNALIIPQDVHDYFMDKELLATEQFVTVVGGNVLDDNHVEEFMKHLTATTDHGKLAATLFFHDHVIAILCLRRGKSGDVWFDVIDSLPNEETLRRVDQETTTFGSGILDFVPFASRIRCLTVEALKATIRWFACSRFTDDNKQYLDMYDWDDAHSDFDPRVFQAFVWRAILE